MQADPRQIIAGAVFVALATWVTSCASAPELAETPEAALIRHEGEMMTLLAEPFHKLFRYKNETALTTYLNNVAQKLVVSHPQIRSSRIEVFLLSEQRYWSNFSLPGPQVRIYLSKELVKRVEYENQLAAMMSFELGHIVNRSLARRYEDVLLVHSAPTSDELLRELPGPPSEESLFSYTGQQYNDAVRIAVQILYMSGYDPRGLVAYFNLINEIPSKAQFGAQRLSQFLEWSYQAIAQYTPLRNPIVSSDDFRTILERFKTL